MGEKETGNLLSNEELEATLIKLGLTRLQTKVYIALGRLDTATGRASARAAKIAPADIYRVLSELYAKGLLEKVIANPNKYRAIPLREGISMLLEQRDRQTSELKKIRDKVVKNCLALNRRGSSNQADFFFVLDPGKKAFVKKVTTLFETAQRSIDLMTNFKEAMVGHEALVDLEVKRLKAGVKIREILSKTQECSIPKCFLTLLGCKPSYQVRFLDYPEPANILIKDSKEVFISTIKARIVDQPHLCSNNPIIARIVQEWYDNLWEKTSEL